MVPPGADNSSEEERERTRPARLDVTADFGAAEDAVRSLGSTLGPAGEKQPVTVVTGSDTARPRDAKVGGPRRIGAYEIVEEIGRGGMGVVYKARDLRLKRTVALKVVLAGGHAGEVELARFQTEAEAVASLRHPCFVQIHEVGSDDGLPYLALEYCGGGSLEDRIEKGPLAPRAAALLAAKLADAMDHAHGAGVIHRDLKPANVLFDENGEPKITDFGLAKKVGATDSRTRTISVMGSVGYMSPEQAGGNTRQATPAVDIYSLGAILYRMLVGRTPFEGATIAEALHLVIHGVPVPIRRMRPTCPRDLETICLKCLEKAPSQRYRSAAELASDLNRHLRGEPITARAATPLEQLISWTRRNPLPTSIAVVAVLMLALLAGAMAWTTYRNYQVIESIERREMRVQELRGQILHLDEVLTGSAYLAAATGEPRWEERYQAHLPKLVEAIERATELVPDATRELAAVDASNATLANMESQAFTLLREGRNKAAWELLNGPGYQGDKREYAEGLASFSNRLKQHSESTIQAARNEATTLLVVASILGGLVALILLVGMVSLWRILRERFAAEGDGIGRWTVGG